MHGKLSGWDDTIVALATPPGMGAIGVIRISGKKSFEIADTLFSSKKISEQQTHSLHAGFLKFNHLVLDEVVISVFRSPKSYTGEDVIEISCHGSAYIQSQIIQAIVSLGARLAKPGEFTQRAFLNGKLDLAQAESVADLIASNTEASKNAAIKNMRGGFSMALKEIREELLQFSALIELELDFSQEDVAFADRTALLKLMHHAKEMVVSLIESFQLGNVIKNGVQVAIVGKPNAGKSTLLNNLLKENRAIVSEIAGTTRDTIEEVINIDGILFRLIDTAGIRESSDTIEAIGVEKSMEKMAAADMVIYLFDVNTETVEDINAATISIKEKNPSYILAGNKTDITGTEAAKEKFGEKGDLFFSAQYDVQLDELKKRLSSFVLKGKIYPDATIITNTRHLHALKELLNAVTDIEAGMTALLPGDLLAIDIRKCLHYLGEITGEITNEDQLDYIFSKFCIGK